MKLVCFLICFIFLLQDVKNKVKYSDNSNKGRKCHGLQMKDCVENCGLISNVESCFVKENNVECKCKCDYEINPAQ